MSLSNLKIPEHQHQRRGSGSVGHPSSRVCTYLKRCSNRKFRRLERWLVRQLILEYPRKKRYWETY